MGTGRTGLGSYPLGWRALVLPGLVTPKKVWCWYQIFECYYLTVLVTAVHYVSLSSWHGISLDCM